VVSGHIPYDKDDDRNKYDQVECKINQTSWRWLVELIASLNQLFKRDRPICLCVPVILHAKTGWHFLMCRGACVIQLVATQGIKERIVILDVISKTVPNEAWLVVTGFQLGN